MDITCVLNWVYTSNLELARRLLFPSHASSGAANDETMSGG